MEILKDIIVLGERNTIEVEVFEVKFGNEKTHNNKYNYFKEHEKTTSAWLKVFNNWKRQGILT